MKKLTAILALLICIQMAPSANAATSTTENSSTFSKLGRILKIMTEDETTTVESEKSSLKKVSDFFEQVENGKTTTSKQADSTISDLQQLRTAIKNNDTATVKKLLNKNNVNTSYSDGSTSLFTLYFMAVTVAAVDELPCK